MSHKMNHKDTLRAAAALMNWFKSQDIGATEAVTILTLSLVELMAGIAEAKGLDVNDGGKLLADCIVTALKRSSEKA